MTCTIHLGGYCIYSNSGRSNFFCKCFGKTYKACFCRGIMHLARASGLAPHRGDVYYPTRFSVNKIGEYGTAKVKSNRLDFVLIIFSQSESVISVRSFCSDIPALFTSTLISPKSRSIASIAEVISELSRTSHLYVFCAAARKSYFVSRFLCFFGVSVIYKCNGKTILCQSFCNFGTDTSGGTGNYGYAHYITPLNKKYSLFAK